MATSQSSMNWRWLDCPGDTAAGRVESQIRERIARTRRDESLRSRFDRGQNRRGCGLGGRFGSLGEHGRRSVGSKRIDNGTILQGGIGKASALAALPHDGPLTILLNELHASALAPPNVDLAGQGDPGAACVAQGREMRKERGVGLLRPWIEQIVGMNDEAEKTVF